MNFLQIILLMKVLISASLLPQSPLVMNGCLLFLYPPLGLLSLNGQMKLLAALKFGPQVATSWMRSSTQLIPTFPNFYSTILLSESGTLLPSTLTNPLL